ncbi:hypothetical protein BKA66DRAFT_411035 [Pyrenochaeta sp. MPI-SDFR-AT-0127]|nr:hypothetical protein BKA66DRAFT_411035 [Pyrenochaeta sp. MPI-SDFR-AT-0127]
MDFEYDSGSSLVLTSSRASAVSSISIATASTSGTTSTASTCALKFACPDCNLKFRTAGLRRNHHNRKHNLRYTCVVCTVPFGLRADLERHEHTVHSDLFRSERRFWCTVPGCAIPKKEFNRKDNFDRHVERCRRTAAKGKGPAWTPT